MSAGSLAQNSHVEQLLGKCRRQILLHTLLRGSAMLLTIGVTSVLLALLIDFLFDVSALMRGFFLVSCVVALAIAVWKYLAAPLMSSIPQQEVAAAVDLTAPELQESLATLVALADPQATPAERGSEVMRARLRSRALGTLQTVRSEEIVDTRQTWLRAGTAAAVIVAALVPFLVWPSGSQILLQRLVQPFQDHESATDLYFVVQLPASTVARGSDVVITATPAWHSGRTAERPEQVALKLIADSGVEDTLPMSFDELSSAFVAEITSIAGPLQFRVVGGGATSRLYHLNVVDAPEITAALMTATPPEYTGRAISHFDGMVGTMHVFEGSQLAINLQFSKPVQSAALVWTRRDERPPTETQKFDQMFDHVTGEIIEEDPEAMGPQDIPVQPEIILAERVDGRMAADGRSAQFEIVADVGGDFVFEVLDEHQIQNQAEPDRTLDVQFDMPPQLEVSGVRNDDAFRPADLIPVNCHVTDDIGIGELELHYRVNDQVTRVMPADNLDRGATVVQHGFRLRLADLGVQHGDFVSLRVRAADERPAPRPQEVWSPEITVSIDDNASAAGANAMQEHAQEIIKALELLQQEVKKDTDTARDLQRQASRKDGWDDQDRSETQRLSEKEQQQGSILDRIAREVDKHPLMKDSAEKLAQTSEQLRSRIPQQLENAVEQPGQDAARALRESAEQLRDVEQELQKQIQQIREAAQLEQDLAELNRLALDAEQLANDARQLDQQRSDPDSKPEDLSDEQWQQQLDQQQQQIGTRQQQLSHDLGQLLQNEEELLEAARESQQQQLRQLAAMAEQLAKQQQRVADAVQQEAKETATATQKIAEQLKQVRAEAEDVSRRLQKTADVQPPELDPLDNAIRELDKGNLAAPKDNVDRVAQQFDQLADELSSAPAKSESPETADPASQSSNRDERPPAAADNPASPTDKSASETDKSASETDKSGSDADDGESETAQAAAESDNNATGQQTSPSQPEAQTSPQNHAATDDAAKSDNARGADKNSPMPEDSAAKSQTTQQAQQSAAEKQDAQDGGKQNSDAAAQDSNAAPQQTAGTSSEDAQSEGDQDAQATDSEKLAARNTSADGQDSAAVNSGEPEPEKNESGQGQPDGQPADNQETPASDGAADGPTASAQDAATAEKQRQERNQAARQSAELAQRLNDIAEQIDALRQSRIPPAENNAVANPAESQAPSEADQKNPTTADSAPPTDNPSQASPSQDAAAGQSSDVTAAQSMLSEAQRLAEVTRQLSERTSARPEASTQTKKRAQASAEQTAAANDEAAAGQFSKAAEKMRDAAKAARQVTSQSSPQDPDQQQWNNVSEDLARLAGNLNQLQNNNAAQTAAQQKSQQQIADQTAAFPQQLNDLAERLGLPELQMPQQAQQAGQAQQAAQDAAQNANQASENLQQGQLGGAQQNGQQSASSLKELANLARQAGQQQKSQSSRVPTEVGESVADALQDLKHAAQAMQQQSADNGNGKPSDQSAEQSGQSQQGQQPGQGDQAAQAGNQPASEGQQSGQQGQPGQQGQQGQPSGSQNLSQAAKALADAANKALPNQFNPANASPNNSDSQNDQATGNTALWNGLTPNAADAPAGSRDWGKRLEELESETSDRMGISRDSEYETLIRMYFREVARATADKDK